MALSESQAPAGDREPHASLTVHALNVLTSLPATGLAMRFLWLEDPNASWMELMKSATNTDGRLDKSSLALQQLKAGTYKLHFETGPYWHQLGYYCFYPYMEVLLPDWVKSEAGGKGSRRNCGTPERTEGQVPALLQMTFLLWLNIYMHIHIYIWTTAFLSVPGRLHHHRGRTKGPHPAAAQTLFLYHLQGKLVQEMGLAQRRATLGEFRPHWLVSKN
ncbi:uncharacterized protein LOC121924134 isoform X1 [Sceloporus undulatus]|uniref:uncharacterized protein LOC121924134 isoform X1 n=1 Tax=Sceloporus undulatus TaxID=8520 RepID=UPI001C4A7EE8|nr:uncharacterized protein LOC121924134 isoform X1 [Sceloporus undulatus]